MQWFQGGIAEAVATSKQRNAVFVVFVEGKDEASQKTIDAINSPEVSAKLQGSGYVAIRIESDTTAHRQFAQIYQMVPVPSLFFIGNSGLPIEVLAGATDSQTLLGRLQVVEAVHAGRQAPAASPTPSATASSAANVTSTSAFSITTEVASSAPPENVASKAPSDASITRSSSADDGAKAVSSAATPVTSAGNTETKVSASSSTTTNLGGSASESVPVEERVERAKELLEKKRLEKMKEEQEEERRKEIERRKMGRDVQEMKKWQQEQELKELKEQRKKEKEENALARQRVLDQIAQDRANRSAHAATFQRPQTSTSELTQRSPPVNDGSARLQFRLPNGSTHTSSFESTSSLGQVRSYLTANVELPFRSFMLATTFPRREFREEDNSLTLEDLGLVPTAVMLVIPAGGSGVVQRAGPGFGGISGAINNAIWALLSPVITVFTALRNRLIGERPIDRGTSTSGTGEGSTTSTEAKRDRRSKRASTGGTIRRAGSSNIHRLHQNNSSSDDDNNTWNGNSTQQM